MLGNFPNGKVAIAQKDLGFLDGMTVEPLHDGESADFLDDGSKVVGRDAELVGIELYLSLAQSILIDHAYELMEESVLSGGRLLPQGFFSFGNTLQFHKKGGLQVPDDFWQKRLQMHLVPHQTNVLVGQLPLVIV